MILVGVIDDFLLFTHIYFATLDITIIFFSAGYLVIKNLIDFEPGVRSF